MFPAEFEERGRIDPARKAEVVLEEATLIDCGPTASEDDRLEARAGGEDAGGEAGRAAADDRDVVTGRSAVRAVVRIRFARVTFR